MRAFSFLEVRMDGVSNRTKANLVKLGLNRPEDFTEDVAPAPAAVAPSGDPTKKVTQAQYDVLAAAQKKRADAAYIKYRQRRGKAKASY
jgi:hypothetical protein